MWDVVRIAFVYVVYRKPSKMAGDYTIRFFPARYIGIWVGARQILARRIT